MNNKIKAIGQSMFLPAAIIICYLIVFFIGYNVGRVQEGRECLSQMEDFLNVIYELREKCQ